MAENLFNSTHKSSNPKYREVWDKTFNEIEYFKRIIKKSKEREEIVFKYHQDFKPYYELNDAIPRLETKQRITNVRR